MTLRQLFYRLVSEHLIANKLTDYKTLSKLTAAKRREGTFPALVDPTRSMAKPVKPGQRSKPRARVTYHELRHTAATMMLTAGKSLPVVARQLGHGSSQITATVYEHLLDDALLDDALEAFSEAFESPHTPARTPTPDHLDSEETPEPA